jgi:ribosomal protein S19
MFIRKAEFEKLLKQVQTQRQEIETLDEKLGILAQSLGHQFEVTVGKGWNLATIRPEHHQFIDHRREKAHASDSPVAEGSTSSGRLSKL